MTYAENPDVARQLPRGRMKVSEGLIIMYCFLTLIACLCAHTERIHVILWTT